MRVKEEEVEHELDKFQKTGEIPSAEILARVAVYENEVRIQSTFLTCSLKLLIS